MQQITVQKLWPLEGKPNGGFKGTDGKTYKCDAATYGRLQEGMTFESNVKPSEWQGKTFYWLPKDFKPDNNTVGAIIPQPAPNGHASPAPSTGNGYVPEQEKQGYIMCSVMMKILADAQTQGGHPPNTEDMALFAQCATAVWRDHLKGKV